MNQVLQTAFDKVSIKGFVDYDDFTELGPPNDPYGQWSLIVKKTLIGAGFVCHEAGHIDEWLSECNYTKRKTHFHLYKKH